MITKDQAITLLKFYDEKANRWLKGSYANARGRRVVEPSAPSAVCWCSVGALTASGKPVDWETPEHDNIVDWNDSFETFQEFECALKAIAEGE